MRQMVEGYTFAHSFRAKAALNQPLSPPAVDRLSEVRAPMLIVVGDQDDRDVRAIAECLEAGIAGAKRIVFGGGSHMLNIEQRDAFNQSVLDFFGGVPST